MSDTPQTDAALKVLSTMKIPYNAWNDASFVSDFAHKQMSDTPRTDVMENNKEVVVDCAFLFFARQLERELAAKDKELADIRAERLRNETFWLGFLQDKLAAQQESTNEKNTTQTNL